jgi:hypothetical protein
LGIFSGDLEFTAYKGSNLLRQEAIASTQEPSVAYIYKAGLKGFAIADETKLVWRDNAQVWQEYSSAERQTTSRLIYAHEIASKSSTPAKVPLPFFPRHISSSSPARTRSTSATSTIAGSFSLGAMQPEHGEGYAPWGVTDPIWNKRAATAYRQKENYALYNAPAGTAQRMAVYYYLSTKDDHATQQAILAYTHNDVFKPVPGFKVVSGTSTWI